MFACLLQACALALAAGVGAGVGASPLAPGSLSFSSSGYGAAEVSGAATITLRRTGGTDGAVVGKVTLADVTTGPADYRFAPGTPDSGFNAGGAGPDSAVLAVASQPDGKVVIAGSFQSYNGDASAPDFVMRLNADGTRDASFNAGGAGADGVVNAVALQPDGKVLVGGGSSRTLTRLEGDFFVTWPDGDAADKTVRLPLVKDALVEADETLGLSLAVVSGGAALGSPASSSLTIADSTQLISIHTDAPMAAAFGASFTVAATSSSGLPVSYSAEGACTNVGATFTMTAGTGTCTVKYEQPGDGTYSPAPQLTETVTAQKAAQTVTFNRPADKLVTDADFQISATASSGLGVSFAAAGNCTVTAGATPSSATVHITGAGSCTLTASQGGDGNYNAAAAVQRAFIINKLSQSITFDPLPNKTYGDADFRISATASSGLPVTFHIFFGSPCTLNESPEHVWTVHINGAGSCRITATQFGDETYAGASAVARDFNIARATTSVAVSSSVNPSAVFQSVTFTATVSSPAGAAPSGIFGTVSFFDGAEAIPNCTSLLSAAQTATCTTGLLSPGTHTISAEYGTISPNFTGSRGTLAGVQIVGGLFEFSQALYTVGERGGQAAVTVRRLGSTSQAASVDYSTEDGGVPSVTVPCDATAGQALERCDYTRAAGTLQFAPGEAQKSFNVLVNDDSFVESAEATHIRLSNASAGASLGGVAVATLEITDDAAESEGNPVDGNAFFVRQHYHDFLNREPDALGLNHWSGQMLSCGDPNLEVCRINVSAAFFLSIEFRETGYLVERIYKAAYGDAEGDSTFGGAHKLAVPAVRLSEFLPDTQQISRDVIVGFGDWERQLAANKQAYAMEFVRRARFRNAFPAATKAGEFVTKLDRNAGGVLTEAERATLADVLAPNPSDETRRALVLLAVADNAALVRAESNRAFVLMQYFGYLRRDPAAAPDADYTGLDFWLSKLDSFGGDFIRAEMVKAFINSDEYRRRFGQ